MAEKLGPRTQDQLARLASTWKQGEHVVISGSTGSGKTALARHIMDIRLQNRGHVVVFLAKLAPDATVQKEYAGFVRWKEWNDNPSPRDTRVLLEPDTSKFRTIKEKRAHQAKIFQEAIDAIMRAGHWCVVFDEGLYMCDPKFLNLADDMATMNILGRSQGITTMINMQRPSNVPLVFYGSASHAFVGRTRELSDLKRLSELGGRESGKELQGRLSGQGRHDFLWIPVAPDWLPETVNLRK